MQYERSGVKERRGGSGSRSRYNCLSVCAHQQQHQLEVDTQSAAFFRLTFTVHDAYPRVEGSERRQKHTRGMHRHTQSAIKYDQSLPIFFGMRSRRLER